MAASWVPGVDPASDFSLANIPFGIVSTPADSSPHAAVAIGASVLDLKVLSAAAGFDEVFPSLREAKHVFAQATLNGFAALGRGVHGDVRRALQDVLSQATAHPRFLRDDAALRERALVPQASVTMHLPMAIGDYTDFYAGYHHAHAVGALFRGPQRALQPNYRHLPVGYHGRASSIVPSSTAVRRPWGQMLPADAEDAGGDGAQPTTAPSRRLDFELELGCLVATGNAMGEPIAVARADEHIFGYVLLNDWSARDVQSWEYVPLGPFNGKNFATTISTWVVLADALEPFRAAAIANDAPPQAYLREARADGVFDIQLTVDLTSKPAPPLPRSCVSREIAAFRARTSAISFCTNVLTPARSARGRHDDHLARQLAAPAVVVPADGGPPLARRLSAADGRSAGLGHHQRAGGLGARQHARDERGRQEGRAAVRHGREEVSEGRGRGAHPRPLRRRRGARRLWRLHRARPQRCRARRATGVCDTEYSSSLGRSQPPGGSTRSPPSGAAVWQSVHMYYSCPVCGAVSGLVI